MRRTLPIALLTTLLVAAPVAAQSVMDLDDLVRRGDVYLHPETLQPYSGPVASYWGPEYTLRDEAVRERGTLSDGRWDGVHEWFHVTGELATRETYADGALNGPSETFFKTGQLSAKENYRGDQLDGPYESYWHRGRLAERGAWNRGEPCGNWLSFGRTVIYPPCPAE